MDTNKPRRKIEFQSFDNPEFWVGDYVKFAQEIGYVSWTWNSLHADLFVLFDLIIGTNNREVSHAIWYSIRSDRSQRAMLQEAAKAKLKEDKECLDEINWLVEQINQISGIRNTTAHVLWTTTHEMKADWSPDDYSVSNRKAVPDLIHGNPLGGRLVDKSAIDMYRQFSGYCMTLIQFCRALASRVQGWDEGEPLPERPQRPQILDNY